MNLVAQGRMLARGLHQEERIRLLFPEKDVQSVRKVIRALNTIDEATRKPAYSASRATLIALVGVLIVIDGTFRNASLPILVGGILLTFFPLAVYCLRAREARIHALPKAMDDLNALFDQDPSLVDVLARIKSLGLEPIMLARVAPYVPQLSNKGG